MKYGHWLSAALLALGAAVTTAGHSQSTQPPFAAEDVERGRYLAVAGDCAACHDAPKPGAAAMAGGFPIQSPIGTIYSTNITPSRSHGIGVYSESQFARAVREGVRADGARLYPAMPYTSYAGLTDEDVHALYAYFMQGVAPVDRRPSKTSLPFPFNLRLSMAAWNMMFLETGPLKPDPWQNAQWNRGRYLAETLAHCSTCHSPRGLLMQESKASPLSGAALGGWYAPNITSDKTGGIGGWSRTEIAQYLRTGRALGKGQAAGDMAEAISKSFSRMTPADVEAIAAYIETIPAVSDPAASKPAYAFGKPGMFESSLRGAATGNEGARLYSGLCSSCHGADGAGTRDGKLPSLFHNSAVGAPRADNLVSAILHGVDRTAGGEHVLMPAFGKGSYVQSLNDDQVAAVATFVRKTFGPGDSVTPAQVALARRGGSRSMLLLFVRVGMALFVLIAIVLGWWGLRRRGRRKALGEARA
jgi:mono/diheme cytochrome c family protein